MKLLLLLSLATACAAAPPVAPDSHARRAAEVMKYMEKNFRDSKTGLYAARAGKQDPEAIWGGGILFSAMAGAARNDPRERPAMRKYFDVLDRHWDTKVKIPGYEPFPTNGGGSDKYYDDNAWMVIAFIEAYEITGDSRYLKRANATLDFVMSGWDERAGGGIWWHERHNDDGKNTCVNAPAAVGCFRIAKYSDPKAAARRIADGGKIVKWTTGKLRGENGLFWDHVVVTTGEVKKFQLTYNSALMLRAYLCLYSLTGEDFYLDEAKAMGVAAKAFLGSNGAYRDSLKWSHLMVEADLELYRWTREPYLLDRVKTNCDANYDDWKKNPSPELIINSSLARELWLLADHETPAGVEFWRKSDRLRN